jgi:hypothetical protein
MGALHTSAPFILSFQEITGEGYFFFFAVFFAVFFFAAMVYTSPPHWFSGAHGALLDASQSILPDVCGGPPGFARCRRVRRLRKVYSGNLLFVKDSPFSSSVALQKNLSEQTRGRIARIAIDVGAHASSHDGATIANALA